MGTRVRLAKINGETPKHVLEAPFYFPATMGAINVTEQTLHSEYDTVAAGRFSQPARPHATLTGAQRRARRGLDEAPFFRTVDLEVMVMDWDAGFLIESDIRVEDFEDAVRPVLRSHRACELLITNDLKGVPELRMFATLRTMTREQRENEVDTRYFALSFSEWRDPTVGRRTTAAGRGQHKLPARHKLRAHDTLHSLSHEYYGTYEGWREIAQRNSIKVGQSYELVKLKRYKVGSVIIIPQVTFASPPGEPRSAKIPVQEFAPIAGE